MPNVTEGELATHQHRVLRNNWEMITRESKKEGAILQELTSRASLFFALCGVSGEVIVKSKGLNYRGYRGEETDHSASPPTAPFFPRKTPLGTRVVPAKKRKESLTSGYLWISGTERICEN